MNARGALLAAALLAAMPLASAAQPVVESVRLVADLDVADASVAVRITFELAGLGPDDAPVAVRALGFRGTTLERVESDGRVVELDLSTPLAPVGRIAVVPDREGRATLALRYRVAGAVDVDGTDARVRIPLLAPAVPPGDTGPGLFEATVTAPTEWRVAEGFPTTIRPGGASGTWTVDLAVVPAMVSLRAHTDGRWRPGLVGLLDGVALACLLGFFVVAGRYVARGDA